MDPFNLDDVPVEALYQGLGNIIVQGIDGEWESASLYAKIENDQGGRVYGRYARSGSTDESLIFDIGSEVYLIFDELRRRMEKPGSPKWTAARFALKRNGTFNLDVSYPDSPRDLGIS